MEYQAQETEHPDAAPRRRRSARPTSLLDNHHTRRLVASQLLIRVQALRDTGTYGERTAEQEADNDLADLLSDVAAELRG
jgi:hypothetical protein